MYFYKAIFFDFFNLYQLPTQKSKLSAKRPKNEHFVTTHFKAVFKVDFYSGGHKCHFDLACDYGLARGL